jgi:hypothetical protein
MLSDKTPARAIFSTRRLNQEGCRDQGRDNVPARSKPSAQRPGSQRRHESQSYIRTQDYTLPFTLEEALAGTLKPNRIETLCCLFQRLNLNQPGGMDTRRSLMAPRRGVFKLDHLASRPHGIRKPGRKIRMPAPEAATRRGLGCRTTRESVAGTIAMPLLFR